MGRDQQAAAAVMAPEKLKLFMGVLALQFLLAGFHIVSRAALNMGISKIVFIVYRNIISLALLAPFAYFLEKCVTAGLSCFAPDFLNNACYQAELLDICLTCFSARLTCFRKDRPPLTFSLLVEFFLLALCG